MAKAILIFPKTMWLMAKAILIFPKTMWLMAKAMLIFPITICDGAEAKQGRFCKRAAIVLYSSTIDYYLQDCKELFDLAGLD